MKCRKKIAKGKKQRERKNERKAMEKGRQIDEMKVYEIDTQTMKEEKR